MSRALAVATIAATMLVLAAPAPAIDVPVPGTGARVDASGYVDGLAVAELGGPRQRPQAITELRLESKLSRALRARLTLRGRAGGPFEGGHPGIMDFVHEFQNHSPSAELNEAYVELREGDLQIRAGIQKFAWGKLDGLPPTDVVTPRDLHDPIVRDVEESKIGIPAIQGTWFLPPVETLDLSELRAQLAWIPIAVPSRLGLADERWFPPSVTGRSVVGVKGDAATAALDLPFPVEHVRVPIRFHTQNHRPPAQLDAGGVAVRLGGTWRTVDWDLYHYTGPETGPNAGLHVLAVCGNPCVVTRNGKRFLKLHAPTYLRQSHDTIHMTGADFSTALGGLTLRGEIAGFVDRPYLRIASDLTSPDALALVLRSVGKNLGNDLDHGRKGRAPVPLDPLFPDRNAIEWGIGADYLLEGFVPLVQVNQVVFADDGPEQLYSNPETRLLVSLKKRFFQDTLEAELRTVYAIERGAWFAYPRVAYRWGDHVRLRLGYLAIGGTRRSYIGQFHANDEFTLEARYSF